MSFGWLPCESVREGDLLLLKRTGGEVEGACDVGEVRIYHKLPPEKVADLTQTYDLGVAKPYFERYIPPHNAKHPVNVAIIELLNVRSASLPPEQTPYGVRWGWVSNFDPAS